jgi:hypothetical protein
VNKITCGKCAKKQNKSLDERKTMAKLLKEGLNECDCGRVLKWEKGKLTVEKEGKIIPSKPY